MADEDPTPGEGGPNGGTPDGGSGGEGGFKPITSQDQLDRIIGERVGRVRAQYADYDDIKAKAGQVDEWRARADELPAKVTETLRDSLVTLGVVADTRKSLLTATTPEGLLEQVKTIQDIERTAAASGGTRRATPPGTPAPEAGEKGRAAAALRELRGRT